MLGKDLRRKYIEFFESKGHLHLPSDSLVPNDASLLFTSAGMVQFKPYFVGAEQPPRTRATTAQKCLRTDDIDEVGDATHHTFFEMMGNFSFGDYFKREAIHWAWEFLTEQLHLPQDRIWTSVYLDDDEAAAIWEKEIGLDAGHIVRLGEDKNYWPANAPSKGPNGPCGPCNEIFLDLKPELGAPADAAHAIAYDGERFVEIWNLVFMQYLRGDGGTLTPLPRRNIDTGLGLERVTAILQGAPTNYDTDLFLPLIQAMEKLAGVKYGESPEMDAALRTIADHSRGAVFCIADGVLPSNVKRGYVLRRMIRRAALKARQMGYDGIFLAKLAPVVAEMMRDAYPEIGQRASFISSVLQSEEEKFAKTLSSGLARLQDEIRAAKESSAKSLSGDAAFTLYDTYGFPLELTQELCTAEGLSLDGARFDALMEEQRQRAREGSDIAADLFTAGEAAFTELQQAGEQTDFLGYEALDSESTVKGIIRDGDLVSQASEGDEVEIVLDRTPFYASSGGQVGDTGLIEGPSGLAEIRDTIKHAGIWLHQARIKRGVLKSGEPVRASVETARRASIMRNHTATHLLHAALRKTLGTHVAQAGSLVSPDRLRFDFSHFQGMTPEEIRTVEEEVNRHVLEDLPVTTTLSSIEEARKTGAMALFGEKYGQVVRIISIGDISKELCGGTHLQRTSEVGFLKIVSESSVAAGVRRIEALTGSGALQYVRGLEDRLQEIADRLQATQQDILNAIDRLQSTVKDQQQTLDALQSKSASAEADELVAKAIELPGFKAVCAQAASSGTDALSRLADEIAGRLGSAVVVLGSVSDGKVLFVTKVSPDLVGRGLHAGNIIREVAKTAGGGGGGKPEFAKAGGKDSSKLEAALAKAAALIHEAADAAGN